MTQYDGPTMRRITTVFYSPFKINYVCPRVTGDMNWRRLDGKRFMGMLFGGHEFDDLDSARRAANSLIFTYHKIRVVDSTGRTAYEI